MPVLRCTVFFVTESVEKTATGAILYDKSIINRISTDLFTADGWRHSEVLTGKLGSAGRVLNDETPLVAAAQFLPERERITRAWDEYFGA